ncbi:uncharacterized protein LOC132592420 isoform X2 [Zootoca vivipara]|uniref:uncharacterized protein LOC132592420 isoform X2 n=1 Tax=Zootoca vivipara TaxID=8524 RepID=UPI00293BE699|nr:uncharacterized protein LOC132592420 isoform X2 [Zootoca vivipara]
MRQPLRSSPGRGWGTAKPLSAPGASGNRDLLGEEAGETRTQNRRQALNRLRLVPSVWIPVPDRSRRNTHLLVRAKQHFAQRDAFPRKGRERQNGGETDARMDGGVGRRGQGCWAAWADPGPGLAGFWTAGNKSSAPAQTYRLLLHPPGRLRSFRAETKAKQATRPEGGRASLFLPAGCQPLLLSPPRSSSAAPGRERDSWGAAFSRAFPSLWRRTAPDSLPKQAGSALAPSVGRGRGDAGQAVVGSPRYFHFNLGLMCVPWSKRYITVQI